ncbi:MAG TPA: DNA polymerase III subunit gamma/tau [Sphingobacteriaceae bacterium]|nr:DNA polymerase III subunit gamma/tau [Sphingobacteriaceae bacterium]
MENFIVSARKYRPATFESVVGQQYITNTLKNAIKNNLLAQAFLFCGPRGVGKTTCARILAKTINCENITAQAEPCGICDSCKSFQHGNSFNIHELDAASNNSVDDIRSLTEQVRIPPQAGKYKIYIIDEVHMLSQAAFNAFLKTLEEPPSYAIFILATTEKHKILPTILSRCQIFDFNRIRIEDITTHLASIAKKEDISYDNDGLHLIAQKADGGLRDALSMFDQIVSFSNRNISYKAVLDNLNILDYDYYFRVTNNLLAENLSECLIIFDEILANGFDGDNFINGLASHFRNLLVGKDASTLKLLEVSEGLRQKYLQQSQETSVSLLLSALNIANQCDINYRNSKNQRLLVELALIKMCHIASALNLSSDTVIEAGQAAQNGEESAKKKTNSPGVTIPDVSIPFPEISAPVENIVIEESVIQLITPVSDLSAATIEEEEPVKKTAPAANLKVSVPNGSLIASASIIPNLSELDKEIIHAEEEKADYVTGESRNDLTEEAFLKLWNEYADQVKKSGKINLFTIMTSSQPKLLEDFKIELLIENKIQEELLNFEKIDLLNFLRTRSNNFGIEIISRITEQISKKRLYTSTDKYQHMAEKNPKIEDFRKLFNLDIEY